MIGALLLVTQHEALPIEYRYVRCAETHSLDTGKDFHLVICMSSAMSNHLIRAKRLSIDTSFKRLHGWEEFEIESWDVDSMRCA